MATCTASYTGLTGVAKLLPGQSQTYTLSVTIPNGCAGCPTNITAITGASSNTRVGVTIVTTPSLPIIGGTYCGTPFNIVVRIDADPTAVSGSDSGIITLTYANVDADITSIIPFAVVRAEMSVDLGQICEGSYSFNLCNPTSQRYNVYLDGCLCPAWSDIPTESTTIQACDCVAISIKFLGTGIYNIQQSCTLTVLTDFGYSYQLTLYWTETECPITWSFWEIGDINGQLPYNSDTYDAECNVMNVGAMGERKYFYGAWSTLVNPVVFGDEIYLSAWMFAQLSQWNFNKGTQPTSGWRCKLCDSGNGIDGTYTMEWYGEQFSTENSTYTPPMVCYVSNGGLDIGFYYEFHLMADTQLEPSNFPVENHEYFLRGALQGNGENTNENSPYRNEKYISFAIVLKRISTGQWQDAYLSIRCRFDYYDANEVIPQVVMSNVVYTFSIPATADATNWLSPIRRTNCYVEFDWITSDPTGTLPISTWLYMFRNDTKNNSENPFANYQCSYADVNMGSPPTGMILSILTPPTYSGMGDRFYFEVELNMCAFPDVPTQQIPDQFRFILVNYTLTDFAVRSSLSGVLECINYDDVQIVFNQLDFTLGAVDMEYPSTVNAVQFPVHTDMQTNMNWLPNLDDAQVIAKTNGVQKSALNSLTGIELQVYRQDKLNELQLINTSFYAPALSRDCGNFSDISAQTGQAGLVNLSTGDAVQLAFPMTLLDNTFRMTSRANFFQSPQNDPNNWGVYSGADLDCIANSVPCQSVIVNRLPDLVPTLFTTGLNSIAFVSAINEIWSCDSSNGLVLRWDATNLTQLSDIVLPMGAQPTAIYYCQKANCVYVGDSALNTAYKIDIFALIYFATSGFSSISADAFVEVGAFIYYTSAGFISKIDIASNTEVLTPVATPASTIYSSIYISSNYEIWLTDDNNADIIRFDTTTDSVVGVIGITATAGLCYDLVEDNGLVYISNTQLIEIIDIATLSLINSQTVGTGLTGIIFNYGVIYTLDQSTNQLLIVDPATLTIISSYATNLNPIRLVFANGIIFTVGNEDISAYKLQPCGGLPRYSWAAEDILLKWAMTFDFLGNQETYSYHQQLARINPTVLNPTPYIDAVTIQEKQLDGSYVTISKPCVSSSQLKINVAYNAPYTTLSVGIELQPVRGMKYFSTSVPQLGMAMPIIPAENQYVSNIVTSATDVTFELDFPALPFSNDMEMIIHTLIK